MTAELSIVVPVYNEGASIVGCLDQLLADVASPCEVLVVYDTPEDTTVAPLLGYAARDARVVPTHNTYGRGPANAIRFGMDAASSPVIVVTMSDGSDETSQIDEMAGRVLDGAAVVAASRYMRGGRQVGGPPLKRTISRAAGLSLCWIGRVGTHDATNSFKAYSTEFVRSVGVESDAGFEIGIELVSKAKRLGLRVEEIPTTWTDRAEGASNFKVAKWIPRYLRWYWAALAPRGRGTAAHPRAKERQP
ncbi:MAG TPA: glycosyltransferase [Actinomycetota bacterium]|nr:glycosyltransferase [Actinomycetota bacterium]